MYSACGPGTAPLSSLAAAPRIRIGFTLFPPGNHLKITGESLTRGLRLFTFGGLTVHGHSGPVGGATAQPRRLAVLVLVARAGVRGTTRARLLALLWPDSNDEQGRRVLNQALYALRRDLGSDESIQGAQELRLNSDVVWCDVAEFETALARGDLLAAAELYVGPFLDGFRLPGAPEFERWADDERTAIQHRFHDTVESIARSEEAAGAYDRAVVWWRRRAADDPLNARVAVAIMRALSALGDRSGALRQARLFEALVAQELELPPDQEVVALAEALRRENSTPTTRSATGAAHHSVAVLPFACLGSEQNQSALERWSDGLVEEIIHALATEPSLRVSARSASYPYGHSPDLNALRAGLSVTHVLEGSVRGAETRVRVSARLIELASGHALWSERIEHDRDDTHGTQDEIAAFLSARIRKTLI